MFESRTLTTPFKSIFVVLGKVRRMQIGFRAGVRLVAALLAVWRVLVASPSLGEPLSCRFVSSLRGFRFSAPRLERLGAPLLAAFASGLTDKPRRGSGCAALRRRR